MRSGIKLFFFINAHKFFYARKSNIDFWIEVFNKYTSTNIGLSVWTAKIVSAFKNNKVYCMFFQI